MGKLRYTEYYFNGSFYIKDISIANYDNKIIPNLLLPNQSSIRLCIASLLLSHWPAYLKADMAIPDLSKIWGNVEERVVIYSGQTK